ncbi:MAG: phospho-sugar mutase [Actinomycetales bacterium]|nr:phospho-sugar mutase [Actinomycetales bacterium]
MLTEAETAELAEVVREWIADDPDEATAAELQTLLDASDWDALEDRFTGLLQFGTAGLRGALGGGPHRMNRAVVIRAARGLVDHLLAVVPTGRVPRLVIGFDARHNSDVFARDTAAVATAAGVEAMLLPSPLPTPVLAFAVRHLEADAGVMVTASHNPPQDNGYKVYLGGEVVEEAGRGVQIVPPHDAQIARAIAAVRSVADVPRVESGWTVLGEEILEEYLTGVAGLSDGETRDLRIVTTPLHGVGGAVVAEALRRAGFHDVHVVPEQAEPDPEFPTVSFPNPEEPGAIDLALALAESVGADLVIANDPDADRCALAAFDPRVDSWRMLHGDELGALLGAEVARRVTSGGSPSSAVLASSIVSSRLLGRIAAAAGLQHAQTLTGFKWIARVPDIVFGYEEAIGYCVAPELVRDKDGISAAVVAAQLADRLKESGSSLVGALDDLARRHGLYLTDQLSARFADLALIGATMTRVLADPPSSLVGSPVVEAVDLTLGTDTERLGLPPTEGLRLVAEDGTRVIIRPSGTEPKVKCYLEVIAPLDPDASDDEVTDARRAARERLEALKVELRATLGL